MSSEPTYQLPLPPIDDYEIDPEASGKKVHKRKGRRYIEEAYKAIVERDGLGCRRCGTLVNPTIDHIIPHYLIEQLFGQSRGESYEDLENLEILCRRCNRFKASRLDFLNPKTKVLLTKYVEML